MKAAVVEMPTVLADVQQNMRTAEAYVQRASQEGGIVHCVPGIFHDRFCLQ